MEVFLSFPPGLAERLDPLFLLGMVQMGRLASKMVSTSWLVVQLSQRRQWMLDIEYEGVARLMMVRY